MNKTLLYVIVGVVFGIIGFYLSSPIVDFIKQKDVQETGCLVITEEEGRIGDFHVDDFPCLRIICDDTTPLTECLSLIGVKPSGS